MKYQYAVILMFCLFLSLENVQAQDLDPRAYVRIPIRVTILGFGFGYTYGNSSSFDALVSEENFKSGMWYT